jgi:SAM-dependent methyltransferase
METPNHWFDGRCARAFWDQRKALPYQELLNDTVALLDVRAGERWLDLGCGGGALTAELWRHSRGQVGQIVASDCSSTNNEAIAKLREKLSPRPAASQLIFHVGDFSRGLPDWESASFDGIVSGLAISYAESRDPHTGRYTDAAYNGLLAELFRVLKPGGRLVFSVNVPEPRFWKILWRSLWRGFRMSHARRAFMNALKMQSYGRWLKRAAREGRFHFLPLPELLARLERFSFAVAAHRTSYAGQAYVIRAEKRAAVQTRAA